MTFFYTNFRTKMKFALLLMISWGTGGCQDDFVRFLSLLAPQTRGTSVMSSLFHSVRKGIRDEFVGIWGLRLRSSPAIFIDQGQISRVISVSDCMYGMVGSSFEEKKLNDNNCTKLRRRGWLRRWRSLGNLENFIMKARHYNQLGGWTNKPNFTHTLLENLLWVLTNQ